MPQLICKVCKYYIISDGGEGPDGEGISICLKARTNGHDEVIVNVRDSMEYYKEIKDVNICQPFCPFRKEDSILDIMKEKSGY